MNNLYTIRRKNSNDFLAVLDFNDMDITLRDAPDKYWNLEESIYLVKTLNEMGISVNDEELSFEVVEITIKTVEE